MKIEVKGNRAHLYVNDAREHILIVNHLLHGDTKGAVALFISLGSVAHFSNLRVWWVGTDLATRSLVPVPPRRTRRADCPQRAPQVALVKRPSDRRMSSCHRIR